MPNLPVVTPLCRVYSFVASMNVIMSCPFFFMSLQPNAIRKRKENISVTRTQIQYIDVIVKIDNAFCCFQFFILILTLAKSFEERFALIENKRIHNMHSCLSVPIEIVRPSFSKWTTCPFHISENIYSTNVENTLNKTKKKTFKNDLCSLSLLWIIIQLKIFYISYNPCGSTATQLTLKNSGLFPLSNPYIFLHYFFFFFKIHHGTIVLFFIQIDHFENIEYVMLHEQLLRFPTYCSYIYFQFHLLIKFILQKYYKPSIRNIT